MGNKNGKHELKFLEPFPIQTNNGLYLSSVLIPDEVLVLIFTHIESRQILHLSLVCKKWNNLVKSDKLWKHLYFYKTKQPPKNLPWYCFYSYLTTDNFTNLIKNGNGQEKFDYWEVVKMGGDGIKIESPPEGSDPLDLTIPDFNNHQSCFTTSFTSIITAQIISLTNKRLLQSIIRKYKPKIYVSEWIAARHDSGYTYKMMIKFLQRDEIDCDDVSPEGKNTITILKQIEDERERKKWIKVETSTSQYPSNMKHIIFLHEGTDSQNWVGHFGAKMAGAVVRFDFDSLK